MTVVHLMDTLMERQLDRDGGGYLRRKMEALGRPRAARPQHEGDRRQRHASKASSSPTAAASTPTSWSSPRASVRTSSSAASAGLTVNRGIVVNDYMETSRPDIFAVGECVEHNGVCYGLVAPLIEQGKVLAATITGNKGPTYTGSVQAAKLKIMGVDVFSAGDWSDAARRAGPLRGSGARRLQEARRARRQAGRRDPGRRHVGQPPLHGLAAVGHRPHGPAPASAVPAAGRRTPGSTSRRWPTAPPSAAASA